MAFLKYLFLICGLWGVSSCGVGTLYGPSYYEDTNLGEGLLRVTFKGGYHPATGELCLLRCAEVCLEAGFSYFEVVDSESGSSLEGHGSTYPFDQHYPARDRFMDDVPFVSKTIRMLKAKSENNFVYTAKEIKTSLRRKYEVK
ncbi:MAG: hypothetical protein P8N49_08060 [Opitutales bacterium]|nr:hypothetical protein [Opitutales bacterium]